MRAAGSGLADGVTGVIAQEVAVQAPVQRKTEPSVVLFAPDPVQMQGFAPIRKVGGGVLSLNDLGSRDIYLNVKAADELGVRAGDRVLVFAGPKPISMRVNAIVRFDGAGTDGLGALVPLGTAQHLLGKQGQVKGMLCPTVAAATSGVGLTDQVVRKLEPTLGPLGLEALPAKQDALEEADAGGQRIHVLLHDLRHILDRRRASC